MVSCGLEVEGVGVAGHWLLVAGCRLLVTSCKGERDCWRALVLQNSIAFEEGICVEVPTSLKLIPVTCNVQLTISVWL